MKFSAVRIFKDVNIASEPRTPFRLCGTGELRETRELVYSTCGDCIDICIVKIAGVSFGLEK